MDVRETSDNQDQSDGYSEILRLKHLLDHPYTRYLQKDMGRSNRNTEQNLDNSSVFQECGLTSQSILDIVERVAAYESKHNLDSEGIDEHHIFALARQFRTGRTVKQLEGDYGEVSVQSLLDQARQSLHRVAKERNRFWEWVDRETYLSNCPPGYFEQFPEFAGDDIISCEIDLSFIPSQSSDFGPKRRETFSSHKKHNGYYIIRLCLPNGVTLYTGEKLVGGKKPEFFSNTDHKAFVKNKLTKVFL